MGRKPPKKTLFPDFPAPSNPSAAPGAPLPMPWDSGAWDQGFWDSDASLIPSLPKKRTKTMPKSDYIPNPDAAFSAQLQTFKNNIGGYAALLGVSAAQIAAQAADAAYLAYVLACNDAVQNSAQQWTAWKNLLRGGGTAPAAGAPLATVFPATVAAVALGIEVRVRALCQQIKLHPNYNEGIGEALGIEGAVHVPPPGALLQPVIEVQITGGHAFIKWGFQGNRSAIDLCEIQVDRGDGHGFVLLVMDTTPNYTDTTPFPATPVKWTYRAIYRKADAQVGQWSNPVSVNVG